MVRYALCALLLSPLATAGDAAPVAVPHSANLELDRKAAKRKPGTIESSQLVSHTPGLTPLVWPKASDMRARLVTPELRRTPVVGWVAANLYRSKRDSGWSLEIDPGEGEYIVFYRLHLK